MNEAEFHGEIVRLHERIDEIAKASQANGIGIAVIVEKLTHVGTIDACLIHKQELGRFESILHEYHEDHEEAILQLKDEHRIIDGRMTILERSKIRTAGFLSGVTFIAGLVGSLITIGATVLAKWISAR